VRRDRRIASVRGRRAPAEVPEAEMKLDGSLDAFDASVESFHQLLEATGHDPEGGLVDLDVSCARRHGSPQLRIDERHEPPCDCAFVRVDIAWIDPKSLRYGTLERSDEGPRRPRAEILDLRNEAVALGNSQRTNAPKGIDLIRARKAKAALGLERFETVDPIMKIPSEVGPEELSVGDDVDTGLDHLVECDLDRIAKRLVDIGRTDLPAVDSVAQHPDPGGNCVASDHLGRKQREVVPVHVHRR
jgi:hypothetical protein